MPSDPEELLRQLLFDDQKIEPSKPVLRQLLAISDLLANAEKVENLDRAGFTQAAIAKKLGSSQPVVNRYLQIAKKWPPRAKAILQEYAFMFEAVEVMELTKKHWSDVKTKQRKGCGGTSLTRYLENQLRVKRYYRNGHSKSSVTKQDIEKISLRYEEQISSLKGKIAELSVNLKLEREKSNRPYSQDGNDLHLENLVRSGLGVKAYIDTKAQIIDLRGYGFSEKFSKITELLFDISINQK